MCLIAIALGVDDRYPVVVAANRDEFLARPAEAMHWWPGAGSILAGRDLEAGGTWLGVAASGRYAALTNYRDPARHRDGAPSRGALVPAVLRSALPLADAVAAAASASAGANPWNLLAGEGNELVYYSSLAGEARRLQPGVHVLSNHLLGTPWPKVDRVAGGLPRALAALPAAGPLLQLMGDRAQAPDGQLPATGVPLEWERRLSSVHIRAPGYGTRCTTLGWRDAAGAWSWHEWTWDERGEEAGRVRHAVAAPA